MIWGEMYYNNLEQSFTSRLEFEAEDESLYITTPSQTEERYYGINETSSLVQYCY